MPQNFRFTKNEKKKKKKILTHDEKDIAIQNIFKG